ncbi:cellulose biosynthesis cyclic di-GMP-binding regulatory protein BcsB [Nocardia arthritidis]|uniref:Cellulose biosynthesis cyclic di-GMP-binding regulatory protein BcsB n=1 Tax=Nocardia arthritidis TaxID=228602 RepID=A0A6G9Y8I5_9NOCA|nr:cellulose biosynthesis cyclic di-GMP-binding regulatory protein BcsB [Nocardia arthritidis]QIS09521.1 hypothetical protein F5544_08095 [Nocardia arthritidis]
MALRARLQKMGLLGAACLIAVLPGTVAPGSATAVSGDVPLALPALGMGKSLTFPGGQHQVSLVLPVLPGLSPTALIGTIQLPPHVARGTIEVASGDRLVDRIELPIGPPSPIRLSLAGAEVKNNAVALTLTSSLLPDPGWCVTDWWGRPLTLADANVVYSGEEIQPTTIADFLPPILHKLTMYLPAKPTEMESNTAMSLSTAIIARYSGQPVVVEVRRVVPDTQIPDHNPGFLERQVVIGESADAGLRLTNIGPAPVLRLTGDRKTLPDQTRLLTSDLTKVAISSGATAVSLPSAPRMAPDSVTLSELGQTQLSSTSIGQVRVDFGADQSRIGRPARDLRVRLLGTYTPLPETMSGSIMVEANGKYVDGWPVDSGGRIDRWIDIPNADLTRFTTISVTMHQTGLTQGCGLERPVTLTIDPDTEITSKAALPPIPGGFDALPQGLQPRVQVGMKDPGFGDTVRAVTILTGLQRLSVVPMRPEVVPFDRAASGGGPALLIAASGGVPSSIKLPLDPENDELTVTETGTGGEKAVVRIDPTVAFGSLQTTWSGGRTVVVASSTNAAGHLDRALDWLNADLDRWQQLHGAALFQAGDRDPEFFDPNAALGLNTNTKAPQEISVARKLVIAGSAVAAVAVLVGVVLLLRRRGTR